jgi:hypothetical protein
MVVKKTREEEKEEKEEDDNKIKFVEKFRWNAKLTDVIKAENEEKDAREGERKAREQEQDDNKAINEARNKARNAKEDEREAIDKARIARDETEEAVEELQKAVEELQKAKEELQRAKEEAAEAKKQARIAKEQVKIANDEIGKAREAKDEIIKEIPLTEDEKQAKSHNEETLYEKITAIEGDQTLLRNHLGVVKFYEERAKNLNMTLEHLKFTWQIDEINSDITEIENYLNEAKKKFINIKSTTISFITEELETSFLKHKKELESIIKV